jgi:ABC-type sugar transport system substrate-binding protein
MYYCPAPPYTEVVYSLPSDQRASFPRVLTALEERAEELGVGSCGVSCSTLEEVFLNVAELLSSSSSSSSSSAAAAAAATAAAAAGASSSAAATSAPLSSPLTTLLAAPPPVAAAAAAAATAAAAAVDVENVVVDFDGPQAPAPSQPLRHGLALAAQQYRAMLWWGAVQAENPVDP